jgi:7-cyano-7-deazaguanine synthase
MARILNPNESLAAGPSSLSNTISTPVLVLLSGGIDSTTCIHYYGSRGFQVTALFVDYGQPQAVQENGAASAVCDHYKIPLRKFTISGSKVSAQYVRARNALLLTLALMHFDHCAGIIALGIHSGTPYVDCSPNFTFVMREVFNLYEEGRVRIDTPFIDWTKRDIWIYAKANDVPLHLTCSSNLDDLTPFEEPILSQPVTPQDAC